MSDIRLHEILTRAVVGRGDRRVVWSHTAPADGAANVLGVHVSNAGLSVEEKSEANLRVSATCDLWCDCGDETRVLRLVCTHTEPAAVPLVAEVIGNTETKGSLIREIRCLEARVKGENLILRLEAIASVEVTGMARFWVRTYDLDERSDEYDEERDESLSGSSSGLSESESSGSYMNDVEAEEDEAEQDEAEEVGLSGEATLAASTTGERTPLPPAPPAGTKPVREEFPSIRTSAFSRFHQSARTSRVSVIQGM